MKLHKIETSDKSKSVSIGALSLSQLKLLANALTIDIETDKAAGAKLGKEKTSLLNSLNVAISIWQ